jgi:hypothetical protein
MAVLSQPDGGRALAASAPYASVAGSSDGGLWEWSWEADFTDDDADGHVAAASGGTDCDDDDASAYPGGVDVAGDSVDGDCDGWTDGVIAVRTNVDEFAYDLEDFALDATVWDFEGYAEGATVGTYGSVTFSGGIAAERVHGAWAANTRGLRVTDRTNTLTLTFASPIDAMAFRLLDPEGDFVVSASGPEGTVVPSYTFAADADNRPDGAWYGWRFAGSVDTLTLRGGSTDGFGLDELEIVLASTTDSDGDGYADDEGDCDDGDPDVSPGAVEVWSNGIDDDCDGTVDAGSATTHADLAAWQSASGLSDLEVIDFEALASAAVIDAQYALLGVDFDATLRVASDVDGTAPNDTQGAATTVATTTLRFAEAQPGVAFTLLDADASVTLTASRDGETAYTLSISGTGGAQLVAVSFEEPMDTLVVSSSDGTYGLDDPTFGALGLDDADGDGLTEAEGDCVSEPVCEVVSVGEFVAVPL